MHHSPRGLFLCSFLAAAAAIGGLRAQALELDVAGGSLPGPLDMHLRGGLYPFELVLVVPSASQGPTPCAIFDPGDPRSLDIGLDLVDFAWPGLFDFFGDLHIPTALGAAPALQDLPLYFQAVTFQWQPRLLDRISNPAAIHLGNTNSFRERSVFFFPERAFATVCPRPDRKWLLVGGARGQLLAQQATDTTSIYDPLTDLFSPGPQMTAPRSLHGSTQLGDGRWLLTGGVNATNDPQASCEIYDPATDSFTPVAPMSSPRMGHTATLLGNGRVLVTGGLIAVTVVPTQLSAIRDATNTTEIYDPLTNTWSPGPLLSKPRAAHVSILRPDGKVLLAGGISWDPNFLLGWVPTVRASCDLYDPVANTMTAGPSMATARSLVDPIDLGNGRWLLAGGINGISIIPWNPGNPTANAEIYDAVANTWTSVAPMATARGNHRGWALGGGRFLLAGGANGSILSPSPLASTEVFSTATNSFTPGPAMTVPRAGATAFKTPLGQIQLFGGASTGNTIVASTEWYFF
jgi:hypothetical protein